MFQTLFILLMTLRLLVPPGVCLCHIFESEPHTHHEGDDHAPGCPASKMAGTPWLKESEKPHWLTLSESFPLLPDGDDAVAQRGPILLPPNGAPLDPPLYLCLCALRI